MDAIILAGGHGTDLKPLTSRVPKHLLPIANRPALAYAIEALRASGVERIAITVNGEEQQYREALGDGSTSGVSITYLRETAPQGTAGCLRAAVDGWTRGPVLVLNGNLILSCDLLDLIRAHQQRGAVATVALTSTPASGFGRPQQERVRTSPDGRLLEVAVDYAGENGHPAWRPAGLYLFERSALEQIPPGVFYDLKEQLLPQLVASGLPVLGHPVRGYLRELNSAEDYLAIHFDVLRGRAGARLVAEELTEGVWTQGDLDLAPDALLVGPVILGPGVSVGKGARLIGPLAVGAGAEIGDWAQVRETVLGEGTRVGPRARVERCILVDGARVPESGSLLESVVAEETLSVGELSLVERDLKIAAAALPIDRYLGARVRHCLYRLLKRSFDLAFAVTALVLCLPVMALVAIAIRRDSRGPTFFRQRRCGKDGKEFVMLKLRSMRADAEGLKDELRALNTCDGPMFKIPDDPRFTRVGRMLRRYSLDELPQLWNVLMGDMSVVGPRPLAEGELRLCPGWRETRLRVKPGLTGLWQINSRERNTFHEWIRHDLKYVRSQSFLLDLKIVVRTVAVMAKGL